MQNNDVTSPVTTVLNEYVQALTGLLEASFVSSMNRVLTILNAARTQGATIYIAGNGGSASTASHWVNDLGKATRSKDKPPVRVMSLNDNVSWLTALANDEGYDRVFAGQLENFARPGDVLLLISASGNSPNLLRAAELAKARGVHTVALLGFDGGALRAIVEECLLIPSKKGAYGLVESGHSMLCHVLTTCLSELPVTQPTRPVQETSIAEAVGGKAPVKIIV
jgi:D-sedoheptulose 7-phosphate isomerase